jgi:hypothetical protein
MSTCSSDNVTHKNTVNTAEGVRQVSVAAAGTQAAINAAEIVFYRACRTSALTNNVSPTVYIDALRALGTGGA